MYYKAVRYEADASSLEVYKQLRQLVHDYACELSAYRIFTTTLPLPWIVVVIGEQPNKLLQQQIEGVMQSGAPTTLTEEEFVVLLQRRSEETRKGNWVEHHVKLRPYTKKVQPKRRPPRGKWK